MSSRADIAAGRGFDPGRSLAVESRSDGNASKAFSFLTLRDDKTSRTDIMLGRGLRKQIREVAVTTDPWQVLCYTGATLGVLALGVLSSGVWAASREMRALAQQ